MQQALLYQLALAMSVSAALLSVCGLGVLLARPSGDNVLYVVLMSLLSLLMWVGLLAAKRGHAAEVALLVGLPLLGSTVVGILIAHTAVIASFSYAIALAIATVMLRPRLVAALFALCVLLSCTLFAMEAYGYTGPISAGNGSFAGGALATLLTLGLVTLCGVRGQQTLRQAQAQADTHTRELTRLHQELRQRQQELETGQVLLVQRNELLQQKLATVGELGVGVLPLAPGVLVVPLHGEVSMMAAHAVRARLVAAFTAQDARVLVLHMQHVHCRPAVARIIGQTVESLLGLGVEVVVCGCGAPELLCPLDARVQRLPLLSDVIARYER